jgi:galactokinase/mevalonate kinase-like predicted kinase
MQVLCEAIASPAWAYYILPFFLQAKKEDRIQVTQLRVILNYFRKDMERSSLVFHGLSRISQEEEQEGKQGKEGAEASAEATKAAKRNAQTLRCRWCLAARAQDIFQSHAVELSCIEGGLG